jgi:hypothetical protein
MAASRNTYYSKSFPEILRKIKKNPSGIAETREENEWLSIPSPIQEMKINPINFYEGAKGFIRSANQREDP